MDLTLVMLAAGIGSRYGGDKQLDTIGPSGELLLDYAIYDAINAGFNKLVFIIRKGLRDAFDEHYRNRFKGQIEISYVNQDDFTKYEDRYIIKRSKPWGTGHAMLSTYKAVKSPFVVLNADDYYGVSVFSVMADTLQSNKDDSMVFLMGYKMANTLSDYGTVSRGLCKVDKDFYLKEVKELTKITRQGGRIVYQDNEVFQELDENDLASMNFWGFYPSIYSELDELFKSFIAENYNNPKAEFYIPTFVDILLKKGKIKAKVIPTGENWMGVTYKEDKPLVETGIMELIKKGVYPERLG